MLKTDYYGNYYKWFVGIVKDILGGNAVRVRIFGIHNIEDDKKISDKDLPIAYVMYPVDYSNLHIMKEGDWVYGFFLDGDDCQQPVVTGIFTGGGLTGNARNDSNQFDCGTSFDTNLTGDGNAERIYNFLYRKFDEAGALDPHIATVGMLGNLKHESGLNTTIKSQFPGENSFGIAQWNSAAGRFGALQNYAARNGGSKENWKSLFVQLNFLWHELQTSEKTAFKELMKSTNVTQATKAALHFFKPAGYNRSNVTDSLGYEDRLKNAATYYKIFKNSYQPGPASETPSGLGP